MPLQFDTEYKSGPLASLEQNGYVVNQFSYPIDLTADPGQQHFVLFYINESQNTQYKTIGKGGPTLNTEGQVQSSTPLRGEPAINQADNVTGFTKRPINRTTTAIALYMPAALQTSYQTVWEAFEGASIAGAAKALSDGDRTRALKEMGIGIAVNAMGDAKDFMGGLGITADVENGASYLLRAARNPHLEMIFKTIGFRQYQFDFKFTPRSEQEALNVANIIKAFKFYSSPEVKQGQGSPRYYIYPAEFDIEFWSNGKPNDFVNKISTCACTNVTVNYTSSGAWSAFRPGDMNGVPVETSLSLQFQELEIITKNRVLQGY